MKIRSAAAVLTAALLTTATLSGAPAPSAEAAPIVGTKASYATPVMEATPRADGLVHLDTSSTISRLQDMNANTYVYLVWNDETQWPDLVNEFLPAAQAADITVWVYLTPPSEGAPTPYGSDYVKWAKKVAELRSSYPNVTGLAIDDFDHNTSTFTPAYLNSMRAAADAVSPGLEIYATVYKPAMTSSFATKYNGALDGYIFPFRDDPTGNTVWTGNASSQVDSYVATAGANKVFLMPYAGSIWASRWYPPDVNYVAAVTQVGMDKMAAGKIAGVVEYALPLTPGVSNGATNWAHTGKGSVQLYVPAARKTATNSWAAANATVKMNPGSTKCTVNSWYKKTVTAGTTPGYHELRINMNSAPVWSRDVSLDGTSWYTTGPQNLAPHMVNGSGTLSYVIHEKLGVSNYEMRASFDDLTFSGCSIVDPTLESNEGWWSTRSANAVWVFAAVTKYSADYSSEVLQVVADLYN